MKCVWQRNLSLFSLMFSCGAIAPTTSTIESFLAGTFLCNFHWSSPVWKSAKLSLEFQRQISAVKNLDLALLCEWWHSGKLGHAQDSEAAVSSYTVRHREQLLSR